MTRVEAAASARALAAIPDAVFHERARAVTVDAGRGGAGRPGVAIVTAGTADVPVAEEARVTAEAMGEAPVAIYDVGVGGSAPPARAARGDPPRAACSSSWRGWRARSRAWSAGSWTGP